MDLFSWMSGTMDDQNLTSTRWSDTTSRARRSHPGIYCKPAHKQNPIRQVPVEVPPPSHFRPSPRHVTRSMSPMPRRTGEAPTQFAAPFTTFTSFAPCTRVEQNYPGARAEEMSSGYSSLMAQYYLHPKAEMTAATKVETTPATSPGSPHADKLSTTTPSTSDHSDHSDIDRSPPRSDYSPNISDNEFEGKLLEPVPVLASKGPPATKDAMPFSGLIGGRAGTGKLKTTRVRSAASASTRAYVNDGEMRSLEDEMADLTKDLLALKAQVSSRRSADLGL